MVLDGFGWFAVLTVTMNYFERSAEHAWIKKDSVKSTPSLFSNNDDYDYDSEDPRASLINLL